MATDGETPQKVAKVLEVLRGLDVEARRKGCERAGTTH